MALKLFSILADPNAPSLFEGLDVSLAEGKITALDASSNSFTMTASTLTANNVSATWADIVDGVVNPPSAPTLQAVLDAGNSANGELSIADASGNSVSVNPDSVVIANSTNSLTLSPSLSSSAGGSSDQYLVVTINGTAYRISLLAPPA